MAELNIDKIYLSLPYYKNQPVKFNLPLPTGDNGTITSIGANAQYFFIHFHNSQIDEGSYLAPINRLTGQLVYTKSQLYIPFYQGQFSFICLFPSDNLFGSDVGFMDPTTLSINLLKFALVSNDFNIFGILGWIGSLVNDVLTLIGANSGYTIELEYVRGFNNKLSTFLDYQIGILQTNEIISSGYIQPYHTYGQENGNIIIVGKQKEFVTNYNYGDYDYIFTHYEIFNDTYYLVLGYLIISIKDNLLITTKCPFYIEQFGGVINGLYVLNQKFYDSEFNEVLGPELPSPFYPYFTYNNIGYAFNINNVTSDRKMIRFAFIGNKWIVGNEIDIGEILIEASNGGYGMSYGYDGSVSVIVFYAGQENTVSGEIKSYLLSVPLSENLSFPQITSAKICGC